MSGTDPSAAGEGRPPTAASRRPPGATAATVHPGEPVDPDVDLHVPSDRAEVSDHRLWTVLAVIAVGGAAGAVARYGVGLAWPARAGGFPWGTFAINVLGSGSIGVLMALVAEQLGAHPLVRPFLGTGVLGGFTTFSTYAVDVVQLVERRAAGMAAAYAVGTLAAALGAVWAGAAVTRAALKRRGRGGGQGRGGGGDIRPSPLPTAGTDTNPGRSTVR